MGTPAVCTLQKTPTSNPHSSSSQSNPYPCTHANQPNGTHFVIGIRIRAHGVLLNLWRLCIMLESVEIMQRRDIMPPFSVYASVLFPCLCHGEYPTHFILFFPSLILNLIFFSLPSQFVFVVLPSLLLSLYSSPSFFSLQSLPLLSASPP